MIKSLGENIQMVKKGGFYFFLCVTSISVGLLFLYYSNNVRFPAIATLTLVLITLLPIFYKIKNRTLELFEPFTLVFLGILIYFIFPAIDLTFFYRLIDPSINLSHYGRLTTENDYFLTKVIFFSTIGVISLYSGYCLNLGKRIGRVLPVSGSIYSRNILLLMGIFYILLGIAGFGYNAWRIGGVVKWFATPKGENIFLIAKNVYGVFLLNIFIPATIILFVYVSKKRSKLSLFLWIGIFIVIVAFYNLSSCGSRRTTLFLILSLIIYYHYAIRPISLKKIILTIAILLFLNFSIGVIRGTIHKYNLEATKTQWLKFTGDYAGRWHNPIIMTMDFPYCYNSVAAHLNFPLCALLKGTFRSREISQ